MANWIILTGADIRLLETEITMMAAVNPAQTIDSCVLSALNFVRGYVGGGGDPLEPAPAIPPECKDDAIAIARYSYLAQDPTGTLLTPIRQKERDDAYKHLLDVAKNIASITGADPTVLPVPDQKVGAWGSATKIDMRTDPPPPAVTVVPVLGVNYHSEINFILTASGIPSLQGLPSLTLAVNSLITIVITVGGVQEQQSWKVFAGAANTADPGQVRPDDYDVVTNNKFFGRVG